FLHALYLQASEKTTEAKLGPLASYRHLPKAALYQAGFVWDQAHKRFLYPIYNRNHALINLKAIKLSKDTKKRRLYASPLPLEASLGGAEHLRHAASTVLVCEGDWDRVALNWAISQIPASRRPKVTVVDVPGERVTAVWAPTVISHLRDKK